MDPEAITNLASGLRGSVIAPSDDGYDAARAIWNGNVDKKPGLIVKASGVADVIDAVNFARGQGLGVSVRGGGHHVAGSSILNDGLVIDLTAMRSVRVDPVSNTVRVEGGAQIGDVDREAMALGRVVPFGVFPETGVAGLTLGGGYGWLRRKFGLSCDNILSLDVVTADGRLVHASATENADLFWALRGGGWDMGVVTSFEFRSHAIDPEMFFLFVAYPLSEAPRAIEAFDRWSRTAPDEASPLGVLWTFPESEAYPPEVWNQAFVAFAGPYAGPVAEGEKCYQPLRELGTPLLDGSEPMPFAAVQHLFDEEYPVGGRYYWKSTYVKAMDAGTIETLVAAGNKRASPASSVDIWLLGGAMSRVAPADTPIDQRAAPYLIGVEANWTDPADDAKNIAWSRETVRSLAPFSTGASYLNFEDLSETRAVAASHGPNYDRLVGIKKAYDPENLFRSRGGLIS